MYYRVRNGTEMENVNEKEYENEDENKIKYNMIRFNYYLDNDTSYNKCTVARPAFIIA